MHGWRLGGEKPHTSSFLAHFSLLSSVFHRFWSWVIHTYLNWQLSFLKMVSNFCSCGAPILLDALHMHTYAYICIYACICTKRCRKLLEAGGGVVVMCSEVTLTSTSLSLAMTECHHPSTIKLIFFWVKILRQAEHLHNTECWINKNAG